MCDCTALDPITPGFSFSPFHLFFLSLPLQYSFQQGNSLTTSLLNLSVLSVELKHTTPQRMRQATLIHTIS